MATELEGVDVERVGLVVHRPARVWPEPVPTAPVTIARPPDAAERERGDWVQSALPALGSLGLVGYAVVSGNVSFLIVGVGMAAVGVLTTTVTLRRQRSAKRRVIAEQRARYLDHLAACDERLRDVAAAQRTAAQWLYPDPARRPQEILRTDRLWERRADDPDFLTVRLGVGRVPLVAPISVDSVGGPLGTFDPDLASAAQRLAGYHALVDDLPVPLELARLGTIAIVESRCRARALLRAVLVSLACTHAPEELHMLGLVPAPTLEHFEWLKWLPHVRTGRSGRVMPSVTCRFEVFSGLLTEVVDDRRGRRRRVGSGTAERTLVLVDGYRSGAEVGPMPALAELLDNALGWGVTVLVVVGSEREAPTAADARLVFDVDGALRVTESGPAGRRFVVARPDALTPRQAEEVARLLAPLHCAPPRLGFGREDSVSLLDLVGVAEEAVDVRSAWRSLDAQDVLRAPVGVDESGRAVVLDLKEPAAGGMGPHGLVIGATGSGKSELLRTLVTALALSHSPDRLAFVLVDFKGGAAFADLAPLPHLAGMVTNLEDDLAEIDRISAALTGEIVRRQRMLRDAGNLEGIRAYQNARADRPDMPPLPYLIVVVDEFSELLAARPDFLDQFTGVGRVGRSLGIHLLLASQRLDEARLHGLEGHLRYRICLRTFSAQESHAVLGSAAAFELPAEPGFALLALDGGLRRFKVALVSPPRADTAVREFVQPFACSAELPPATGTAEASAEVRCTEAAVLARRLATGSSAAGHGRVRQVWLPPLPRTLSLESLLERCRQGDGDLRVPVGLLDRPTEQAQYPFVVDLAGPGGNVAVIGAPQSGKSTFLRTLVAAVALRHNSRDIQVYGIDLGGGGLHAFAGLPHVGTVCSRSERDIVDRMVRELAELVEARAQEFRALGIESMASYRSQRRGTVQAGSAGDVVLVIDNWALFRADFSDLEPSVTEIASTGLQFGVHVVITTGRWSDIRPSLKEACGGRLELRLNDPMESDVGRVAAAALRDAPAGRGLTPSGLQVQVALPCTDDETDLVAAAEAQSRLVTRLAQHKGWVAPPIKLLPGRIPLPHPPPAVPGDGLTLGVQERGFAAVQVDLLGGDAHLVVLGDAGSGKTNVLRLMIRQLRQRHGHSELRLHVLDPRRSLWEEAEAVDGYAWSAPAAERLALALRSELDARLPTDEMAPGDVRNRRWWSGPEHVLLVDDYELLSSGVISPLALLADLLPLASDLGLHVVLARRAAGAARASFEPVMQRLAEQGVPGFLLSGEPNEGPLHGGVRAQSLPPGRGLLVRPGRPATLMQAMLVDDAEAAAPLAGPGRSGRHV